MDYPCGKFGDCSFSRFGFITRGQTDTYTQTDVAKRFTPADRDLSSKVYHIPPNTL